MSSARALGGLTVKVRSFASATAPAYVRTTRILNSSCTRFWCYVEACRQVGPTAAAVMRLKFKFGISFESTRVTIRETSPLRSVGSIFLSVCREGQKACHRDDESGKKANE